MIKGHSHDYGIPRKKQDHSHDLPVQQLDADHFLIEGYPVRRVCAGTKTQRYLIDSPEGKRIAQPSNMATVQYIIRRHISTKIPTSGDRRKE